MQAEQPAPAITVCLLTRFRIRTCREQSPYFAVIQLRKQTVDDSRTIFYVVDPKAFKLGNEGAIFLYVVASTAFVALREFVRQRWGQIFGG